MICLLMLIARVLMALMLIDCSEDADGGKGEEVISSGRSWVEQ